MKKEIIAKELVSFSGQTFSDSKQAYKYINEMLKRVQEATKQEIVEEIESKLIDYMKKLCWTDKDIEYLLRRLTP